MSILRHQNHENNISGNTDIFLEIYHAWLGVQITQLIEANWKIYTPINDVTSVSVLAYCQLDNWV